MNKTRKSRKMITATIDLSAIRHNLFFLQKKSKAEVMVVLKAIAYGLGMIEIAKYCRHLGVSYLGVATVDEALELRKYGDRGKILAWLYDIHSTNIKDAITQDIELAIFDETHIPIISAIIPSRKIANVHLFVDTGINRNGIKYENAIECALQIYNNPKFKLVGVMTHLCCAFMKNKKYTQQQYIKFRELKKKIRRYRYLS
jgi:alanine racemase